MKRLAILLFLALVFAVPAYAQQQQASATDTEMAVLRIQLEHVQRAFADDTQLQLKMQAAAYEARLKTAMEWLQQAQAKEPK